jgi:hypothetical protein
VQEETEVQNTKKRKMVCLETNTPYPYKLTNTIRAQEETEVLAKKSDKGANCKEEKDELDIHVH